MVAAKSQKYSVRWKQKVAELFGPEGFSNTSLAELLDVSPGWVNLVRSRGWIPPKKRVFQLIERLNLPREEWLEAAGYSAAEPRRAEVLLDELMEMSARLSAIVKELARVLKEGPCDTSG